MPSERPETQVVEAFARGLAVIEAFDENHGEMTLNEVARRTGLAPSTARRSLFTLVALGYVYCLNRKFLLMPRILTLGSAYLRAAHIADALTPELRRLLSLFSDAASVGVLDAFDVLYVARISEKNTLRPIAGVGMTHPAYPTSLGRVLLSGLSPKYLDNYFSAVKINKFTEVTETNPNQLRKIIKKVRNQGYAVTVDQLAYGVTSLSVPIRIENRIVAAINSSGYSGHTTPESMVDERLAELRLSAGRIASVLMNYPALLHSLGTSTGQIRDPRVVDARPHTSKRSRGQASPRRP